MEADNGFRGDFRAVCPNQSGNLEESRMKMNARARHETVNRQIKQFHCWKCFRHDKQLHVHCLNAVAVITPSNREWGVSYSC
jgi:predicted hydrolase (HD superfamily)